MDTGHCDLGGADHFFIHLSLLLAFEQLVGGLDQHSRHRLRVRPVAGDGGEVEAVDDGDECVDHLGGGELEEVELTAGRSVVDDLSEQPAPAVEDRVDAVLQPRIGAGGGDEFEPDP